MERNQANAENLLVLAETMRTEQKKYFATRNKDHLASSKKLEQQFDKGVKDYFSPQKLLFDE